MKSVATQAFWLTPREKQLLRRFARGKSDKKIGREIGGTEKQVGEQRQALIKKLCIQFDGQLACGMPSEMKPASSPRPADRL